MTVTSELETAVKGFLVELKVSESLDYATLNALLEGTDEDARIIAQSLGTAALYSKGIPLGNGDVFGKKPEEAFRCLYAASLSAGKRKVDVSSYANVIISELSEDDIQNAFDHFLWVMGNIANSATVYSYDPVRRLQVELLYRPSPFVYTALERLSPEQQQKIAGQLLTHVEIAFTNAHELNLRKSAEEKDPGKRKPHTEKVVEYEKRLEQKEWLQLPLAEYKNA